jgi:hypothetical protein
MNVLSQELHLKAPFTLMPSCLCIQTLKAEKRIAARLAKNLKAGWFPSGHNHHCVDYYRSSQLSLVSLSRALNCEFPDASLLCACQLKEAFTA